MVTVKTGKVAPQMASGIAKNAQSDDRYTVYTVCLACGEGLAKKRPQALFCSNHCRFAYHNERRRKRKTESPPSAAIGQAGVKKEEVKDTHRITFINRRGTVLAFTAEQLTQAKQFADELGATASALTALQGERYLNVREVLGAIGLSHARLYQLLDAGRFPRATLLSPPGAKRRVGFKANDVRRWLKQRQDSG